MDYTGREREIAFSRTVKAGKRIYYIDVKRTRADDYYLSLTESKKVITGEGDEARATFEKHKLFIYKEDIDHVLDALEEATRFIKTRMGAFEPRSEEEHGINLNIEF